MKEYRKCKICKDRIDYTCFLHNFITQEKENAIQVWNNPQSYIICNGCDNWLNEVVFNAESFQYEYFIKRIKEDKELLKNARSELAFCIDIGVVDLERLQQTYKEMEEAK